jgi:hypothetical protein
MIAFLALWLCVLSVVAIYYTIPPWYEADIYGIALLTLSSCTGKAYPQKLLEHYTGTRELLFPRKCDRADRLIEEDDVVERSALLVNTKVGVLLGKRKFPEAESAIARLRLLPGDDGRADGRHAHLLMKRDHNFGEGERRLTALVERRTKGQIGVRNLRAVVAIANSNLPLARQDIEFVRSKPGTLDESKRLEIRFKLASGDTEGARAEFTQIGAPTPHDLLLEARILEAEADTPSATLTERNHLRQRALERVPGMTVLTSSILTFEFCRSSTTGYPRAPQVSAFAKIVRPS